MAIAASSSAPAPEIQPAASSPNDNQIPFQVFRKEAHYENFAYLNSKTLKLFPLQLLKKRFSKVAYVAQINDKLVLHIRADNSVPDNHVAIHYLHADFLDLLFTIPPPPGLELTALGLEVEDTEGRRVTASHQDIAKSFIGKFKGQIFCKKQLLFFNQNGVMIHMRVSFVIPRAGEGGRGKLSKKTEIHFFESDVFEDSLQKQTRFILHGPPGTGKTSIARAISKILNGKLQVVRGPEIFSGLTGSSEAKIRELFYPAINDLEAKGEESPLHVRVFDELDSISRQRGTNPMNTAGDSED